MGKLIKYWDDETSCWSRVNLVNGDPIRISVTQASVMVQKSRWGFLGTKLYHETNVGKIKLTAAVLHLNISQYITPKEMTNPLLRVFTQVALECNSAAELSIRLNMLHSSERTSDKRGPRAERREQVIKDFGGYIVRHPILPNILDVSELPHPKKEILDAICCAIVSNNDPETTNALKITAVMLANFQENVGSRPLTQFGLTSNEMCAMDTMKACEVDELTLKMRTYVRSPERGKYDSFDKIVEKEKLDIQRKIIEAEEFKRELLKDLGQTIL